MAREQAPAFQFYVREFLADSNVTVMTATEIGAYTLLLAHCWQDVCLPNDPAMLAQLARIPIRQWPAVWKKLQRCFEETPDGWRHKRLDSERDKQAKRRQEAKLSAEARWGREREKQCERNANAQRSVSSASASAFASAIASAGEEQEIAQPPSASEPALAHFPTVGNPQSWALTERHVSEWSALYPNLDVRAQLRQAYAWIQANAERRKTARGMPKFLVGWLNRATDRVGPTQARASPLSAGQQTAEAAKRVLARREQAYRERMADVDPSGSG